MVTIEHLESKNKRYKGIRGTTTCDKDVFATGMSLTSLLGFPSDKVIGHVYIQSNALTSLEHCTKEVTRDFNCSNNLIGSLKFGPTVVGSNYSAARCGLKSMKYSPKIIQGNFDVSVNDIRDLQDSPEEVTGNLDIRNNKLSSLKGNLKKIGNLLLCKNNNFTSKEQLIEVIFINNIIIRGTVQSDFGTFQLTPEDYKKYKGSKKIGKFKDFLNL